MGVTNTNAYDGPFYPNGVTTSFPFTFRTMSTSEVQIVDEDGNPVTGLSFSIVPATNADGGSLLFDVAPTAGQLPAFLIVSAPAFGVGIDLGSVTAFNPRTLNPSFERLAVQNIVLQDRLSRTLQLRLGEQGATLPGVSERALKYLGFDAQGDPSPLPGVVDLIANAALGIPAGDTNLGGDWEGIIPDDPTAKQALQAIEAAAVIAMPVDPSRFAGATAAARLAAAIAAQTGKTVTINDALDTTTLPASYTAAALDYTGLRAGRWTHTGATFGKARRTFKAQHPAHIGEAMATLHIETEAFGNQNGPPNADYGASIAIVKKGFGTNASSGGEMDGMTIFARQDGPQGTGYDDPTRSDVAGILINAQKIGNCGWLGAIELSASDLNPTTFAINRQIQTAIGVITGAEDNKAHGFTAAALYGQCNDGLLIYDDAGTGGSWVNMLRGFKADGRGATISTTGDIAATTAAWPAGAWALTRGNDANGVLRIDNRGGSGITLSAVDDAPITFQTNGVERIQVAGSGNLIPKVNLAIDIGSPALRFSQVNAYQLNMGSNAANGRTLMFLDAPPEGLVAAPVGSIVFNNVGAGGTAIYRKMTGTGNTGWAAIA